MSVSFDQRYLHVTFNHIKTVSPTPVNMINCQKLLSLRVYNIIYSRKTAMLKKCGSKFKLIFTIHFQVGDYQKTHC